jgi:hypothetical protein
MTGSPDDPDDLPTSDDWGRMVGSQRHDQYTPMGEIHMLGDFASGARRSRGWQRWPGIALVLVLLVFGVFGLAAAVFDLF